MFVLRRYSLAVFFCFLSMLFWGSWINTQKLTGETWRFELYYWDYGWGMLLMALIFALTMGSRGKSGRGFLDDLKQAGGGTLGRRWWAARSSTRPTSCWSTWSPRQAWPSPFQ